MFAGVPTKSYFEKIQKIPKKIRMAEFLVNLRAAAPWLYLRRILPSWIFYWVLCDICQQIFPIIITGGSRTAEYPRWSAL